MNELPEIPEVPFLHGWKARATTKATADNKRYSLVLLSNPILGWEEVSIKMNDGFKLFNIIVDNQQNLNSHNPDIKAMAFDNTSNLLKYIDLCIFKKKCLFYLEKDKIKPYGLNFINSLADAIDIYCNPTMENKKLTQTINTLIAKIALLKAELDELKGNKTKGQ